MFSNIGHFITTLCLTAARAASTSAARADIQNGALPKPSQRPVVLGGADSGALPSRGLAVGAGETRIHISIPPHVLAPSQKDGE